MKDTIKAAVLYTAWIITGFYLTLCILGLGL
jgi:hypothetical protein